ncbi:RICIN domain-containing protein [Streptosporangium sp. NPDC049376]|uniref:RICIN domain-containing protein n=1 Tax=Streptosporangium sp. NPDC049376 TaxID=3366192 RepID=UPI003793E899
MFSHLKRLVTACLAIGALVFTALPASADVPTPILRNYTPSGWCDLPPATGGGDCYTELMKSILTLVSGWRGASLKQQQENEKFTQSVVDYAMDAFPGYNVMVFKYKGTDSWEVPWFRNDYKADMTEVLMDVDYELVHDPKGWTSRDWFRIWIFRGASTFVNKGDGGYMNWAFGGAFDRSGGNVTFSARRSNSITKQLASDADRISCLETSNHAVQLGTCKAGGSGQKWTYNGIRVVGPDNHCLSSTELAVGAQLITAPCDGRDPRQRWYHNVSGTLRNIGSPLDHSKDLCVDIPGGTTKPGKKLHLWGCGSAKDRDKANQDFSWYDYTSAPGPTNGSYFLLASNGLGVAASGTASGSQVISAIHGLPNSKWSIEQLASGRNQWKIVNAEGLALSRRADYTAEARTWTGARDQKWEIIDKGDNQWIVRLDADNCLTHDSDFKPIGVWTCEGSYDEVWRALYAGK